MKPIYRIKIKAQDLFDKYPSHWRNEYKNKIFDISCPENCSHRGELEITRWKARNISREITLDTTPTEIITHNGPFIYPSSTEPKSMTWHLNFADGDLFFHYGSSLMAQDEHQVAEHPILASVKEMLEELAEENTDYVPCTRDYTHLEPNPPTPVLVMGAERRLSIDLTSKTAQGGPAGLYGNLFREAPWIGIEKALSVISPPTLSNIIAMEAPSGGKGVYTQEQIDDVFQTAFTAFSAAKEESLKSSGEDAKITINTGDWGTGAYGGNKTLMATLQLLAAAVTGVYRLNFYTTDSAAFGQAQILVRQFVSSKETIEIHDILNALLGMNFQWGMSDGN